LLSNSDRIALDNKIELSYTTQCGTSGETKILTTTYKEYRLNTLQSLQLSIGLCTNQGYFDENLKEQTTNESVKRTLVHEIGHYLYYLKTTSKDIFDAICRKEEKNICTAGDFITRYAQTNASEDYAESFAYRYFHTYYNEEF
jgi:hypothetical protein